MIESGLESGTGVESTEFDIGKGYVGSPKVPPLGVCHEAKWEIYVHELAELRLPHRRLSRFLEKVCAPPCHRSPLAIEGWKLILPCLNRDLDWEIPISCWNETEKALRHEHKRPALLRGLALLCQHCRGQIAQWLRLSPHNLCRAAVNLGRSSSERAQRALEQAHRHPVWHESGTPYAFEGWLKRWGPLRPPEWLSQGLTATGGEDKLAEEFSKRQPALQLEVLYRLLRS